MPRPACTRPTAQPHLGAHAGGAAPATPLHSWAQGLLGGAPRPPGQHRACRELDSPGVGPGGLFWPASLRWDDRSLDTFLAVILNGAPACRGLFKIRLPHRAHRPGPIPPPTAMRLGDREQPPGGPRRRAWLPLPRSTALWPWAGYGSFLSPLPPHRMEITRLPRRFGASYRGTKSLTQHQSASDRSAVVIL